MVGDGKPVAQVVPVAPRPSHRLPAEKGQVRLFEMRHKANLSISVVSEGRKLEKALDGRA